LNTEKSFRFAAPSWTVISHSVSQKITPPHPPPATCGFVTFFHKRSRIF